MTDDPPFDPYAGIAPLPPPATEASAWLCGLLRGTADVAALADLLSPAEHARAARFGRPELRDRYVVGRASLRTLLGERLGVPAQQVVIERGPRGRPYTPMDDALDFNVSHTCDVALFGIARGCRIGVDIEHRGRTVNVDGVARKFMSGAEQALLARLDDDERRRTLLRLWTCKEAMSKATGDALSAPFRRLDVVLAPAPRLRDGPAPYLPERWRLHPVAVPGGFLATVALWHGS
jgi:4'-phosphopantetheinyl transferase